MKYKYAYVDSSVASFVVACKSCNSWSTIRFDPIAARRAKADHDERVHQVEPARAADAAKSYQERNQEISD